MPRIMNIRLPMDIGFPSPCSRWDDLAFDLARRASQESRDPSTKAGAVIVRPDRGIVSIGWNDFPRGVGHEPALYANRDEKLPRIVHAEWNAILHANESLFGCTLYVLPFAPCAQCAAAIIQKGIDVVRFYAPQETPERWRKETEIAFDMFRQANVRTIWHGESKYDARL